MIRVKKSSQWLQKSSDIVSKCLVNTTSHTKNTLHGYILSFNSKTCSVHTRVKSNQNCLFCLILWVILLGIQRNCSRAFEPLGFILILFDLNPAKYRVFPKGEKTLTTQYLRKKTQLERMHEHNSKFLTLFSRLQWSCNVAFEKQKQLLIKSAQINQAGSSLL